MNEKSYWKKRGGDRIVVCEPPRYFRTSKFETALGTPCKAQSKPGWIPKTTFEELVAELVREDLNYAGRDDLSKHHGYRAMDYRE